MCNLTYYEESGYYFPIIKLTSNFDEPINHYARMRKEFLRNNKKAIFTHLLLSEQLYAHLVDVTHQSQHLLDTLIPKIAKQQGVNEELKRTDRMLWVGMMNNIKAQVEEIIFTELVYADFSKKERKCDD